MELFDINTPTDIPLNGLSDAEAALVVAFETAKSKAISGGVPFPYETPKQWAYSIITEIIINNRNRPLERIKAFEVLMGAVNRAGGDNKEIPFAIIGNDNVEL